MNVAASKVQPQPKDASRHDARPTPRPGHAVAPGSDVSAPVTPSPALARVKRGDLCAGCGACAALSDGIGMSDSSGYLRPRQTGAVSADAEARIRAVCPGLGLKLEHDAPIDHELWGPIRSAHTVHAVDADLRHEASSGGGLSAMLTYLLQSGAVDFVVQIAADPENPVGNRTVISRSSQEVFAAAGSRYAPSAPLAALDGVVADAVRKGERAAFVGKPCDVAALRAWSRLDANVERVFPYMLSFFCAGVPNLAGGRAVAAKLGVPPDDLATFRYRGRGWPGHAVAIGRDGREGRMTYAESWGAILSHEVQFRCKICPDGIGSFADLAFGDAWEADEKGYPLFEELPGMSLAVARTAKGQAALEAAAAAGVLAAEPFEIEAITPIQRGQRWRKSVVLARMAAMGIAGRPRPAYRGFQLEAAARHTPRRERLKNFLGVFKRLKRG